MHTTRALHLVSMSNLPHFYCFRHYSTVMYVQTMAALREGRDAAEGVSMAISELEVCYMLYMIVNCQLIILLLSKTVCNFG